jgi:3-isopropylmalate dehydrogenase
VATNSELRIAVLAGDGIGPEITAATVKVMKAAARRCGLAIRTKEALIGWKAYEKHKTTLPEATLRVLREHDGWLVGPTFAGEYPKDDGYNGHPNGFLRQHFKLFANVRPVKAWPQLNPLVPDLDITVLRENTQGFYPDRNMAWGYGEFKPTNDVALSVRVITREAAERFAKFAFDYAVTTGQSRLFVAHKRTALIQTDGLFISAFEGVQPKYRKVKMELVRIDTFASSFPRDPQRFRLIATSNLFGDIMSDQASGLAGGVGMAPSLCAGPEHAYGQAVHGTGPDIADKGIANPSALTLSAAMLLRWLYQRNGNRTCLETADVIDTALRAAIDSGTATKDLGGNATTESFAKAVIAAM